MTTRPIFRTLPSAPKQGCRQSANRSTLSALLCALLVCCVLNGNAQVAEPAVTFTTLLSFHGADGGLPEYLYVIQGRDGKFYGTTQLGGTNNAGAFFEFNAAGSEVNLYSFCGLANCADGQDPVSGVIQGTDGNFYGTTELGGANSDGTVFKITPKGVLTTLHSFTGADGSLPLSRLVLGTDGLFYGTTATGGTHSDGTVFKITGSGMLTTLYNFCTLANCADGSGPSAGLIQATDGNFYGTARSGGANNDGTIYKITPGGTLTTLHSFNGTDGMTPFSQLTQAANGMFFGTTYSGGTNSVGTVFKITPAGSFTSLHSFNETEGVDVSAALVQATDGNFYGTTFSGGANGDGTIFEITGAGALTTLYNFCSQFNCFDGQSPYAGMTQVTSGLLYGATAAGGSGNDGTIFKLSIGVGPFVETQPTSGKVGAAVTILGTNLTGATKVTFNGTVATIKSVSRSEISTTVPAGATTGKVQVTTPSKVLNSNLVFRVTP